MITKLFSFILLLTFVSPALAQNEQAIAQCAQTASSSLSPVKDATVIGTTSYQEDTYYLLAVSDPQSPDYSWDMVISLDQQNKCDVPWVNPSGDFISMLDSPVLPSNVAYELAQQRIQYLLQTKFNGSKQALFADVLGSVTNNQLFITPEDYAALQEIGFSHSSTITVVHPKAPS